MSDIYTTTPPTEEGWYWLRNHRDGDECPKWWNGKEWVFGGSLRHETLIASGWRVGPRIPSAEELVEMREAAKELAEIKEKERKTEELSRHYSFEANRDRCCQKCEDEYEATLSGQHKMAFMCTRFMLLCPKCGNKRCPKAADHRFTCTGSNATGQVGVLEESKVQE